MADIAAELAALVADTLAAVEAYRMDGGRALPPGGELPPCELAAVAPAARGARPVPRASPPRPEWTPPPPPSAAPPPRADAAPPPRADAAPPPRADAAPPPPAEAAGPALLGGRWAALLRDPGEKLREVQAGAGERCDGCGGPPPLGVGPARARLAVVAAPLVGEAGAMFDKMLVNVLRLEREDVFLVPAPACPACRELVLRQLEVVRAPAVLALGGAAAATFGLERAGRWSEFAGRPVLGTLHPADLLERPQDKRAVMAHLLEVAGRV